MKKLGWLLLGALAFAGSSVFAVDVDADFSELDQNGDGYVSVDETKDEDLLATYWYKFDENNDGMLDTVELSAFEDASIDDLEPWILRHDWYGTSGTFDYATTPSKY